MYITLSRRLVFEQKLANYPYNHNISISIARKLRSRRSRRNELPDSSTFSRHRVGHLNKTHRDAAHFRPDPKKIVEILSLAYWNRDRVLPPRSTRAVADASLSFLVLNVALPWPLASIPTAPNKKKHAYTDTLVGALWCEFHTQRAPLFSLVWVKAGEGREISGAEDVCTAQGEGTGSGRRDVREESNGGEGKAAEYHGGWLACLPGERAVNRIPSPPASLPPVSRPPLPSRAPSLSPSKCSSRNFTRADSLPGLGSPLFLVDARRRVLLYATALAWVSINWTSL